MITEKPTKIGTRYLWSGEKIIEILEILQNQPNGDNFKCLTLESKWNKNSINRIELWHFNYFSQWTELHNQDRINEA